MSAREQRKNMAEQVCWTFILWGNRRSWKIQPNKKAVWWHPPVCTTLGGWVAETLCLCSLVNTSFNIKTQKKCELVLVDSDVTLLCAIFYAPTISFLKRNKIHDEVILKEMQWAITVKSWRENFFSFVWEWKTKVGDGSRQRYEKLPEISKTTITTAGENTALGWHWRSSWRFAAQHHKNQGQKKGLSFCVQVLDIPCCV